MELRKGQKIKIKDLTLSDCLELKVGVSLQAGEADITCFGVDSQDKLSDDRYFVFYNQTSTPEGAVTMKQEKNGSSFVVQLSRLPSFVNKLVVTVAADGNSTMQNLNSGSLSLCAESQIVAEYSFCGTDFQQEKAVILCELYQKDGIWRLSVVSSGFNGGLSALLKHFGGEEAKPSGSEAFKEGSDQMLFGGLDSKDASLMQESGTPAPAPAKPVPNPAPSQPVSLKKRGDSHKISLDKNKKEIHVNLNWNTQGGKKSGFFGFSNGRAVDLDLACMYRLKNGSQGIVQALGNTFGAADREPFILLDQDDRTGASLNGENMWFKKPELIDFAIVFAYIYEGTPNWQNTGAAVVLKQQGSQDIQIFIDNPDRVNRFCVIASLTGNGSQLEVKREELFFPDHRAVDKHYGFGFRWVAGRK